MYNKYIDKKFYFLDASLKHIYKNRESHSIQYHKCWVWFRYNNNLITAWAQDGVRP